MRLVRIVPGRSALSAPRRARALARLAAAHPGVTGLTARWAHLVAARWPLTESEGAQLAAMLTYGPVDADAGALATPGSRTFWIAPRLGTISPWSSKATDLAHVCGLADVTRIERAIAYTVT